MFATQDDLGFWGIGLGVGLLAAVFLRTFVGLLLRDLKELRGNGPLSRERAFLVNGACLLISRTLVVAGVVLFLLGWPGGLLDERLSVALAVILVALAGGIQLTRLARMQNSMAKGGYGPREV